MKASRKASLASYLLICTLKGQNDKLWFILGISLCTEVWEFPTGLNKSERSETLGKPDPRNGGWMSFEE